MFLPSAGISSNTSPITAMPIGTIPATNSLFVRSLFVQRAVRNPTITPRAPLPIAKNGRVVWARGHLRLNSSSKDSPATYEIPENSGYTFPPSLNWLWSLSNAAGDESLPDHRTRPSPQGQPRTRRGFTGVILELEGVIVEDDDPELEPQAWFVLCKEKGKEFPPDIVLRTMEGMKAEEAISEVLGWSEDPTELERLAARKEEICRRLRAGNYRIRPGTLEFMNTLISCEIPMVVASTRPRESVEEAIRAAGLERYFAKVVAAEDVKRGKPDPEMLELAAEFLDVEPERCVVIGNSDSTVVAAANAGMRSVAVAGKRAVYDFRTDVRVVRWLDELSVRDLEMPARVDPIKKRARESYMEIER